MCESVIKWAVECHKVAAVWLLEILMRDSHFCGYLCILCHNSMCNSDILICLQCLAVDLCARWYVKTKVSSIQSQYNKSAHFAQPINK